MSSVNYQLKSGFEYDYKDDTETAQFIEIREPNAKSIQFTAPLRQSLMRAITEAQRNAVASGDSDDSASDDDSEIDGATLVTILETSSEDMVKVLLMFQDTCAKSKLFYVDGSVRMNNYLYESLSQDDIYGLFGEFLRAFIGASLLK